MDWIDQSEQAITDSHDSVSHTSTSKSGRRKSGITRLSRGSHSSVSALLKERTRIAELKIEQSALKLKQELQVKEDERRLETERTALERQRKEDERRLEAERTSLKLKQELQIKEDELRLKKELAKAEARERILAEKHHRSASDVTRKPDVPTMQRHTEVGSPAVLLCDPVRDRKPDVPTMQCHTEVGNQAMFSSSDPVRDRKPDVPTMQRHTEVGSPAVFSCDPARIGSPMCPLCSVTRKWVLRLCFHVILFMMCRV